ncbi:MAG: hypothetical protein WDN48_07245 [Pseudolabrys sp.]
MANAETGIKRVLQLKMRALGDPATVLSLIRSASPFYRTMGSGGFRVLQNVDDPAQILVEIEYEGQCRAGAQPAKTGERPHGADFPARLARDSGR